MGTHPIFESDFDCLTEMASKCPFGHAKIGTTSGADPDMLEAARQEIERIKLDQNVEEPDRGNLDDPDTPWMNGKPNYSIVNLEYLKNRSQNHAASSLEKVVENLVKTWEMEASHLLFNDWKTVDHEKYRVRANGGKQFDGPESSKIGNYNWLMANCGKSLRRLQPLPSRGDTGDTSPESIRKGKAP